MTVHYFDPSAWIKRHFQETGSEVVSELFRSSVPGACCRLGLVEMAATISRKGAQESLDKATMDVLLSNVRADFSAFQVVHVDEVFILSATELALRHRLRAMDAIHLAGALSIRAQGETVMVSADLELLAAAKQEGLKTLNPASPSR